ncbi:MAG: hypothetical protein AB7F43_11465 [Bacteriovoracia bacterium]
MRRLGVVFFLILVAQTAQTGSSDTPVRIPEPTPENTLILEFAHSIEGTDGTPQGIGKKHETQIANKLRGTQDIASISPIQTKRLSNLKKKSNL